MNDWWTFIVVLVGVIIGIWVGGGVVYLVLSKRTSDEEKDHKRIRDLIETKKQLIRANRELEDEIELRDNLLKGKDK